MSFHYQHILTIISTNTNLPSGKLLTGRNTKQHQKVAYKFWLFQSYPNVSFEHFWIKWNTIYWSFSSKTFSVPLLPLNQPFTGWFFSTSLGRTAARIFFLSVSPDWSFRFLALSRKCYPLSMIHILHIHLLILCKKSSFKGDVSAAWGQQQASTCTQ